jgi:hypothetical protein
MPAPSLEETYECLACESKFKQSDSILKGVAILNSAQYCSTECEASYEEYLAAEVKRAEELGLARSEQSLSEADIRKVVNQFHLKLTKDK